VIHKRGANINLYYAQLAAHSTKYTQLRKSLNIHAYNHGHIKCILTLSCTLLTGKTGYTRTRGRRPRIPVPDRTRKTRIYPCLTRTRVGSDIPAGGLTSCKLLVDNFSLDGTLI